MFKANNNFQGYLGEYLDWGAEIFRIGVSYDPQQYSTTGLKIRFGDRFTIETRWGPFLERELFFLVQCYFPTWSDRWIMVLGEVVSKWCYIIIELICVTNKISEVTSNLQCVRWLNLP